MDWSRESANGGFLKDGRDKHILQTLLSDKAHVLRAPNKTVICGCFNEKSRLKPDSLLVFNLKFSPSSYRQQ